MLRFTFAYTLDFVSCRSLRSFHRSQASSGYGPGNLEFNPRATTSDDHALAFLQCLPAVGRGHFRTSLSSGDNDLVDTGDFDSVASVLLRPYGYQWSFDVHIRISATQFTVGDRSTLNLNEEGSIAQGGQPDRGVLVESKQIRVVQLDFRREPGPVVR